MQAGRGRGEEERNRKEGREEGREKGREGVFIVGIALVKLGSRLRVGGWAVPVCVQIGVANRNFASEVGGCGPGGGAGQHTAPLECEEPQASPTWYLPASIAWYLCTVLHCMVPMYGTEWPRCDAWCLAAYDLHSTYQRTSLCHARYLSAYQPMPCTVPISVSANAMHGTYQLISLCRMVPISLSACAMRGAFQPMRCMVCAA
eukprot:2115008-Rhodomonas_salina.1